MAEMLIMSPAMMAAMTVAMMVAMMLPSIAPTLWRHHRQLRAMRIRRAALRTVLFAAGYGSVWAIVGVAMVAMSGGFPLTLRLPIDPRFARQAGAAVVLCAGTLQCSRWKAKQLVRCRQACVTQHSASVRALAAWRDGFRLGGHCSLNCAAPMAILLVAGLMDVRAMLLITVAITAERIAPAGARIARLTGVLALVAGFAMLV